VVSSSKKEKRPILSNEASLLVGKRDLNPRPQDYEAWFYFTKKYVYKSIAYKICFFKNSQFLVVFIP